jgi:hypothetical protein
LKIKCLKDGPILSTSNFKFCTNMWPHITIQVTVHYTYFMIKLVYPYDEGWFVFSCRYVKLRTVWLKNAKKRLAFYPWSQSVSQFSII